MNEKSVELTKGGGNRYETKKKRRRRKKKKNEKKRDRNNGRSMDTFFEGESFYLLTKQVKHMKCDRHVLLIHRVH